MRLNAQMEDLNSLYKKSYMNIAKNAISGFLEINLSSQG